MNSSSLFFIAIDGANFINRIIEHGVEKSKIVNNLSIERLKCNIEMTVKHSIGSSRVIGIDFFHSNRLIGPKGNRFTKSEQEQLINRFKKEIGITTREIVIPGEEEKGVDIAVASALFEKAGICETLILIASDRDYVPVLESLRRLGKFVVTVGFIESHPIELVNLSFLFIDLSKETEQWYLQTPQQRRARG